jgi:hypothetical protein
VDIDGSGERKERGGKDYCVAFSIDWGRRDDNQKWQILVNLKLL